ncbi:MAG: DUF1015 domain-containing protein [Clostridia bacterium]|nr:DUF1015 domain-containing protein [Clostridia bacterium]
MNIFKSADILIPNKEQDFSKWSVVACDQYTSEPRYWDEVKDFVGNAPSTLNITFPEVFLEGNDGDERIKNINATMEKYVSDGIFEELKDSYIYVERTQSDGKVRHGLIGMIDLEEYDYNKGSTSAVRATEGTIIERIPPRQRIRKNATLELPHIMMLVDDIDNLIIAPLKNHTDNMRKVYDFTLMQNSGKIKGWLLTDTLKAQVNSELDKLEAKKREEDSVSPLIFAVGDGNHSLATAKTCWEELKKNGADKNSHPARYALVELVNLYDDALVFEPIHRVVFDVDPKNLMHELENYYSELSYNDNGGQEIRYCYGETKGTVYIKDGKSNLAIGTIQAFIDDYIKEFGGRVDYIHGENVVCELAKAKNTIGFMVDGMDKRDLYPTVIKDGSLPRKTFSMGEAQDKRFYLEAKKIK